MKQQAQVVVQGPDKVRVNLQVNGELHEVFIEPRQTLLDTLRNDIGLTGAKKGCDEGTCGACTVLSNGKAIYSCLTLAVESQGRSIETIEALAPDGRLHPIQQAFIDKDGYQCGFCTPGQILAVKALLEKKSAPSAEEVKRAVSGNLCRCGAYPQIVEAAMAAAKKGNPGS